MAIALMALPGRFVMPIRVQSKEIGKAKIRKGGYLVSSFN
jgi:hypothetical protein